MAKTAKKITKKATKTITVEDKLKALYQLQCVDSDIDNIRVVRGELPLEIQDLEDDISGLKTRIDKYNEELSILDGDLSALKITNTDETNNKISTYLYPKYTYIECECENQNKNFYQKIWHLKEESCIKNNKERCKSAN